jgi:hypothetical protein
LSNDPRFGSVVSELHHKCLNRANDILQSERSKLLEQEAEPAMHMVPHGSRDADAARWTFSLNSRRNVHRFAVQIGPVCNRVTNIYSEAETDGLLRWLITVMDWNLLLDLYGTAHRTVDAIEHDEQRVATSLNDPTAVFIDRGVY